MAGGSGLDSLAKERALAICPKISASISMPCSFFIVCEVIHDHRTRGSTTSIQRTLLAMSCVDILASSAWFMSTWATPEENGWAYAAGNQRTCDYQGFLLQLAIGAPLYNSSLALLYLLMIKMRWTDEQLRRVEVWIHASILSFTIGTSIFLLQIEQYNHIGAVRKEVFLFVSLFLCLFVVCGLVHSSTVPSRGVSVNVLATAIASTSSHTYCIYTSTVLYYRFVGSLDHLLIVAIAVSNPTPTFLVAVAIGLGPTEWHSFMAPSGFA